MAISRWRFRWAEFSTMASFLKQTNNPTRPLEVKEQCLYRLTRERGAVVTGGDDSQEWPQEALTGHEVAL